MILTCPQCDTKYVVKDGAIPPGGRQVRCASCKHSWHQDPEKMAAAEPVDSDAPESMGGPPTPDAEEVIEHQAVETPIDEKAAPSTTTYGLTAPSLGAGAIVEPPAPEPPTEDLSDDYASVPLSQAVVDEEIEAVDDDFAIHGFDEEEGRSSGRLFKTILLVLALVAIAVAAFWFLAPAEMRSRLGLATADHSPLTITLDTRDRQPLQSGNELLAISGRIQNPTDEEQPVPAIRAELRNRQTQKLVHSWTIRPQSRVLAPHGVTRFNSAEIDVPQGGDDISLSLGTE